MRYFIHRIKYLLKNVMAYILYYTGLLFIIKGYKLKNKTVVLTYHRIVPFSERKNSFSHSAIMVDNINFDRHIEFLKKHFKIINSSDLIYGLNHKNGFADSSCLITFDDGWNDNFDYAFPILKSHNVSALVFPATNYIDTNKLFWQEAMGHGFFQLLSNNSKAAAKLLIDHKIDNLKHVPREIQLDTIRKYVRELKTLPYIEINLILRQLKDILCNINYGKIDTYINWLKISEMHSAGIEFGSHGCSHKILTRLDDNIITEELTHSKQLLAKCISTEIQSFAYPNGNNNERIGKLVKESGYTTGFGTQFGYVSYNDNPFDLKRINIYDAISTNNPVLLSTILGIF